jgi:hypothetical protein
VFCSVECRRATEFEIRRANKRIEKQEEAIEHIRLHGASSCYCFPRDPDEAIAARQALICANEARLRALLAEPQQMPDGEHHA